VESPIDRARSVTAAQVIDHFLLDEVLAGK
jgi:hypothetical protein